jgi:RimJ/RimL family protein N-acetyltransferase
MARAVKARLVRRSDRDAVLAHLARDPLANLFLLDLTARLDGPPVPGELRAEVVAARRGAEIVGVVGLRPSVVFDADIEPEAIDALLPFIEARGVGLVKSPCRAVDALWSRLAEGLTRRAIVDRHEMAYALRKGRARRLRGPGPTRPAREGDFEALVVAARESLCEEGRPDPFEGDMASFRRWVRGRIPRARVVESGGRVVFVGYADVQRVEGWLVQGVYTWPEVRGRGLATTGVSDMCREAFETGAEHVQLAVVEENLAGVRLYEGLGFEPFARLRTILFSDA